MTLKKPSDIFGKKPEDLNIKIVESDNSFRDELVKVENLSDQIIQLQQELSQKVIQSDLEKLFSSQILNIQENFKKLQNDFKKSNKEDIGEFRERVSEISEIVANLIENEIPKYKKQITGTEVRIGERFSELKDIVENSIIGIREEIDTQVNDIAEIIDNNLEIFNRQIQENSFETKKTTDTYNKLSNILESKVSKENEKLEEYSKVIQSIHEEFIELEKSLQEETLEYNQIIEDKFETISSNINIRIESIDENINNKIAIIGEGVDTFKSQVSSEVSNIKADVVIFEKHNKNIQKDLEIVEGYIQNHHKELVELKEEVFGEIQHLPLGNLQDNLERLEKKIDYIKETYSKIEPEVIVKEVIKEGLLNEPPDKKNSDPLTPLDQNFVTLDQLQQHYRLFINRIQQQISTIGGGGETRLKYLDDIVGIATNASAYDGKFLKYNHNIGKFEFVTVSGGGGSQTLDTTLGLGNTSSLGMSVGVVTATSFSGSGTNLTGIVTSIIAGTNVTISGSTGQVTINASGGGGGSSQWVTTDVGIHTLSNVGIGTTNPTSKLHVVGDARITGILTIGTSSILLDGTDNKIYVGSGVTISATEISIGSNIIGSGGFSGNASSATFATNAGIATFATNAGVSTYATNAGIATFATSSGIATFATNAGVSTYATNAGIATYATNAGIATYATNAGIATFATNAGIATYATNAGIATFATNAGVSTYATNAGIATYATNAGIATYATNAGVSTYSDNAGIATYATSSGIATFATNAGVSTYATNAGIATFATNAGVSTYATNAGIATYATNAGISTALQNSRTFQITGDVVASAISFDGTGNVSLAATIQPNSVALGSVTTGDYVQSISGTSNQITVTSGTGEGSTPILSIPSQFTAPQDVTVTRDLLVSRNLNVNGNITIGGTSATLFTTELKIADPDIVLGFRTDGSGNDISNDNTANHGGVALASTEGTPLVDLFIAGIETAPATYKKIMWFKSGTFAGLGTDAWLINYAVGIGSTQFPTGTRLAAGNIQFTQNDLAVVRNINASGVVTATSFAKSGGTSSQFLKADGSVDSSTYLTSYTETDTLNSVTDRGNSTANGISVGIITSTSGNFSGIITSSGAVISGATTATSFVKSGGTSSQFLKADGSVDTNTYLTTTGSGTALTGIVTSIIAGTNVTVSGTGQVTINSTASGGGGAALDLLEVMLFT